MERRFSKSPAIWNGDFQIAKTWNGDFQIAKTWNGDFQIAKESIYFIIFWTI